MMSGRGVDFDDKRVWVAPDQMSTLWVPRYPAHCRYRVLRGRRWRGMIPRWR
jgi:hypothetical protein